MGKACPTFDNIAYLGSKSIISFRLFNKNSNWLSIHWSFCEFFSCCTKSGNLPQDKNISKKSKIHGTCWWTTRTYSLNMVVNWRKLKNYRNPKKTWWFHNYSPWNLVIFKENFPQSSIGHVACRNPTLREVWGCHSHFENGTWESFETPENSKHDCKGRNTLHQGVLYIVIKVLKSRCPKWPCMSHLDICIMGYGWKKGRESNW